jgi:hypothetical protein
VTDEGILAVLKFAGPIVALASALWSTTQKITYEDAGGAKRLTLQGRVLLGIFTLAALVSMLALGFDTLVGQQHAQDAARIKAEENERAAQRDARVEAAAAARDARARSEAQTRAQREAFAQLERDAAEQKRFLEQRFLIAAAAAEQQRRDAHLSMQVAREANARLGEAERTLAEFERINYPLRSVTASAELDLSFDGVEMRGLWERLAALPDDHKLPEFRGGPATRVRFTPQDVSGNDVIDYGTTGTIITLVFVPPEAAEGAAGGAAAVGGRDALAPLTGGTSRSGPIALTLTIAQIEANLRTRAISATFSGSYRPDVEGIVSGGEKLSLSDVDRLVPILTVKRHNNPAARRPPDTIVGLSYRLNDVERFDARAELAIADEAVFVLRRKASE